MASLSTTPVTTSSLQNFTKYLFGSLLFRSVNMSIVLMLLTDWWHSGREHFVPRIFECKILDKKSCIQLLHFLKELWIIGLIRGKFLLFSYFVMSFCDVVSLCVSKYTLAMNYTFYQKPDQLLVKSFVHKCLILLENLFYFCFFTF